MGNSIKLIAFYLPQYYPTETNNKWYGCGFTEWTNVTQAKPLYNNHYQPKQPADLGYYDLREPFVRLKQAELARNAGIYGFCYYHYWFGKGRQELDLPLGEILRLKEPDFPFCLCWANQSWYSKFWNNKVTCLPKLIVEQQYDDEDGIKMHFMSLLDAFQDDRYIKIDGKPLFMIYRPNEYPEVHRFMDIWHNLAIKSGFKGMYFVAQATNDVQISNFLNAGTRSFDAVNIVRMHDYLKCWKYSNVLVTLWNKIIRVLGGAPYHYDYSKIYPYFINKNGMEKEKCVFPTIIPNWDHSPRSGKRGSIFHNSTPEFFEKHLIQVLETVKEKQGDNIVFIKSWNEWGEGNYLEPDVRYGHGYLNVIKKYFKCTN